MQKNKLKNYEKKWLSLTGGEKCRACKKLYKCCDFVPFISNNQLIQIFKKWPDEWGRVIQAQEQGIVFISVLGLLPSLSVVEGRKNYISCPFYHNGACQVWDDRPSVCQAYDCLASWSMNKKLEAIEMKLYKQELSESLKRLGEWGVTQEPKTIVSALAQYLSYSKEKARVKKAAYFFLKSLTTESQALELYKGQLQRE